jgi:hypothetical protein
MQEHGLILKCIMLSEKKSQKIKYYMIPPIIFSKWYSYRYGEQVAGFSDCWLGKTRCQEEEQM